MNKWSSKLAALTVGTTVLLTSVGQASAATYTVKSGDSLSKIGKEFNISSKTIMDSNNLTSTLIFPGQQLIIGENQTSTTKTTSSTTSYTVKSGDSLSKIGSQYGVSYKTLMEWNNLSSTLIHVGQKLVVKGSTTNPPSNSAVSSNTSTYIVKSGDTLSKIGSKYGISYQNIMKLNNLSSTKISVGQKLIISGSSNSPSVSKPTSPTSSVGNTIASIAKQLKGVKYVFGGASPSGFDCSGFITYVYNKAGISTPRLSSAGFYNASTPVSTPQIGDLVFFSNTYKSGISHVGIYIGNNQMISASGYYVQISKIDGAYWEDHFTGYGRLN
ncbi:LysM peptidoglycan-binding domain-containing protein [Lysinibacillus sp. NPDC097287]|uniref:C40 family peptidase n=1 Tax=Lysinibacillus sp. NPDC097287 TaxID=3364144 RepID=UPI0038069276